MTRRWLVVLFEIAVLTVLTLSSGWGALHNPFHFDDALFLESAQVTEPSGPLFVFQPAQSRQLTYLTFYWNYQMGGANPFGYHLVNLLLHLANIFGVYLFASLLIRQAPDSPSGHVWPWIPLAAAALFAVHPIQSEVVNYAYQRSTVLAALFSLLSMNAYLLSRWTDRPWIWRAIAVAAFVLAVASKESALILPMIWLADVWAHTAGWRSFRARLLASWRTWGPIAAVMALGLTWFLSTLRGSADRTIGLPLTRESLNYFLSQTQVLATYLRMIVWPAGLSVDHDFRAASFLSLYSILCIALLAGVLIVLYLLRRANPTPCFLAASFLILLAPTSSLASSTDLLFEHRLYLPMIPASVLMAWGGVRLVFACTNTRRLRQAAWSACIVLGVIACAVVFKHRTWIWGNNVRLWEDAVSKAPWNARAHYNLGVSLLDTDLETARATLLKAVELRPGYAAALYNLGWLGQREGRLGPAVEYYTKALGADPGYWQAHQNLGNLSVLRGKFQEAVSEYKEVIRARPNYWPAYESLATVQVHLGNFESAISTLRTLEELKPDSLEARYLRAYILVAEGKMGEAGRQIGLLAAQDKENVYRERLEDLRIWMSRR